MNWYPDSVDLLLQHEPIAVQSGRVRDEPHFPVRSVECKSLCWGQMTSRRIEHGLQIVIPFKLLAFLQQVFKWRQCFWDVAREVTHLVGESTEQPDVRLWLWHWKFWQCSLECRIDRITILVDEVASEDDLHFVVEDLLKIQCDAGLVASCNEHSYFSGKFVRGVISTPPAFDCVVDCIALPGIEDVAGAAQAHGKADVPVPAKWGVESC